MGIFSAFEGLPNIYEGHCNTAVIGGIDISRYAAKTANSIGKQIIERGENLITGGRKGAGFEASQGAYEACLKLHIDPNKRIFSVVPKGKKPDFKIGTCVQAGKDKLERRVVLIQNSGAAYVIGGGTGTRSEIYIGIIQDIMNGYGIRAVPGTGGEADRICSGQFDINATRLHDIWFGSSDVSRKHDRLSNEMFGIRAKYF